MKIKLNYKRKPITQNIWLSILGLLVILLIISTVTTNMAYQQPTTTTETYTDLSYSSSSRYSYLAQLQNNTVYNKTELRPGEGILFKKLVTNITGTHQYTFQISRSATITTTQSIEAIVQTDIWTKKYTLVSQETSESEGTRHVIEESFPINYQFYDSILSTINEETGINAPNPILIIRSSFTINAKSENYSIYETFNPEITMSLNQKTIEFSDILSQQQSGVRTSTTTINHPEVIETRQARLYSTIAVAFIIIIYLGLTKMQPTQITALEKELKNIKKKYGEWIVTADNNPVDPLSKAINIASMEELSRISEDLGKPMIHYPKNGSTNIFLVIDDEHIYQHELDINNRKEKELFSFFNFGKNDSNSDKKNNITHNGKKDTKSKSNPTKNKVSKTVTCKHCKSSFTLQEETNGNIDYIKTDCPFCGTTQKISVKDRISLFMKFKSFLQ